VAKVYGRFFQVSGSTPGHNLADVDGFERYLRESGDGSTVSHRVRQYVDHPRFHCRHHWGRSHAGVALVSATVTDQSTILLDNTTVTVTSRDVGYGVQFDGGSLQRGARLILRGGAISGMAGTAAAVRFDSAARIDSTNITVVLSTWLLTGVSLSNADFLASTLTVTQSNMSLHGGNSSYLLLQRGAATRIDQSSIMIADSIMTIIGVMNASATVLLTGNVNESSVVVQSCHITTTAARWELSSLDRAHRRWAS
jgi:hypothetical protein